MQVEQGGHVIGWHAAQAALGADSSFTRPSRGFGEEGVDTGGLLGRGARGLSGWTVGHQCEVQFRFRPGPARSSASGAK
jgi:hypothetical protein